MTLPGTGRVGTPGTGSRGAVFVDIESDVPAGELVVFSAHGVPPEAHTNAAVRGLHTVDATCPLVTKVHAEARLFASLGYTIFLVGHAGHDEIEGTLGEAPAAILLVQSAADAERVQPPQTERLAYLTQTTLSVDDTAAIVAILRRRFPGLAGPRKEDICYATSGASAPERLVQSVCSWFAAHGVTDIRPHRRVEERVAFKLPALAAAPAAPVPVNPP